MTFDPEVRDALERGHPVVALESTVISHGLPWPRNLETARDMMAVVRRSGSIPAVIGISNGAISIGLDEQTLERFAKGDGVEKVSRRDIAAVAASGGDGATTVAATMILAHRAGIQVFATGGIGGVHRGGERNLDISADLVELSRTPVLVVASGAKSILDLPRTIEVLETQGVPIVGYGVDHFPAFHVRDSGLQVSTRVDDPASAAAIACRHWAFDLGGLLFCNPVPEASELPKDELDQWIDDALAEAAATGVAGKEVTPFLLGRIADASGGRTLTANRALLLDNARVAGEIAVSLSE